MTLDILICSLNKGIVRIDDLLRLEQDGVRYVVSYQYTDERYLELVPDVLKQRKDVVLSVYKGTGDCPTIGIMRWSWPRQIL